VCVEKHREVHERARVVLQSRQESPSGSDDPSPVQALDSKALAEKNRGEAE